jgi:hypothetical protein
MSYADLHTHLIVASARLVEGEHERALAILSKALGLAQTLGEPYATGRILSAIRFTKAARDRLVATVNRGELESCAIIDLREIDRLSGLGLCD